MAANVKASGLPDSVTICGVRWDIKWVTDLKDDDGNKASGCCHKHLGVIQMELEQGDGLKRCSLLHEIIHACSEMSGWRIVDLEQLLSSRSGGADGHGGMDLEEIFVSNIEPALFSVLRSDENAALLKWLMFG